jgi:membrane protein implicated in regulation of membrane protease activity
MGLIAPPPNASFLLRLRGFAILVLLVLALVAIGFALAKLIALPFGGVGTLGGILLGLLIVAAVLGVLALLGRRRQERARTAAQERAAEQRKALRR